MTSNDLKETSKESVKYKKNETKRGYPNYDTSTKGRDLIEQSYSSQ